MIFLNEGETFTYAIAYDNMGVRWCLVNTITVTNARQNLYQLVNETNVSHIPVQIIGKQGSAVLVSLDDWKAIEETLFLSNIPGMAESIKKGRDESIDCCTDVDEVFEEEQVIKILRMWTHYE